MKCGFQRGRWETSSRRLRRTWWSAESRDLGQGLRLTGCLVAYDHRLCVAKEQGKDGGFGESSMQRATEKVFV
jgi:hypothetical protein